MSRANWFCSCYKKPVPFLILLFMHMLSRPRKCGNSLRRVPCGRDYDKKTLKWQRHRKDCVQWQSSWKCRHPTVKTKYPERWLACYYKKSFFNQDGIENYCVECAVLSRETTVVEEMAMRIAAVLTLFYAAYCQVSSLFVIYDCNTFWLRSCHMVF
jgi:hypothetical protein